MTKCRAMARRPRPPSVGYIPDEGRTWRKTEKKRMRRSPNQNGGRDSPRKAVVVTIRSSPERGRTAESTPRVSPTTVLKTNAEGAQPEGVGQPVSDQGRDSSPEVETEAEVAPGQCPQPAPVLHVERLVEAEVALNPQHIFTRQIGVDHDRGTTRRQVDEDKRPHRDQEQHEGHPDHPLEEEACHASRRAA